MSVLHHALRRLAVSPGFTLTALVTLALGIGVNTNMFSVLRTIAVRTLPYPDSDQLVRVYRTAPQANAWPHSPANFLDQHAQNTVFSHYAAYQRTDLAYSPGNSASGAAAQPPERIRALNVTGDFFPLLGVSAALGRTFGAAEDQPGQDAVVVLSHAFWSAGFARDPKIVGRVLRLGGQPVTVIGVMPPQFEDRLLWGQVDAWRPMAFTDAQRTTRGSNYLQALARLKPGLSLATAQAGVATLAAQLALAYPENNASNSLRLAPLAQGSTVDDGAISWFIMALAVVVLLIACANLANLQFARTAARAREYAIRAALGASRTRLMLDVLAESLLLSFAGGALAVLVALWTNDVLGRHFVIGAQTGIEIATDWRVLGFALAVSAATGLAFGLLPAWLSSRTDIIDTLKQSARGATASRRQHRLRHLLIVSEVALALVLLSGAAFFTRGLQQAAQRDPGWAVDGLLTGYISLQTTPPSADTPEKRAAHRAAFFASVEERLAALPGVEHVALARSLPTWGYSGNGTFVIEGRPTPARGLEPLAYNPSVTPAYFATLGLRLVQGRAFTPTDRADTPAVTVINETMARALWPGENPLGKRIGSSDPANPSWREIVGVVSDARAAGSLGDGVTPFQMYRPWAQSPGSSAALALRTRLAPEALAPQIRQIVASLDPDQPVHLIGTVRREIEREFVNLRLAAWTLSGFAILGLLLAAVGIYAVIAHSVVQRTNEIGIRLALGAQVRDILSLVLVGGLRLALIGTVIGLAGSFATARLLYSIAPALAGVDPLTVTAVIIVLVATATLACWLPARRATRVDPIIALRSE